MRKFILTTIIAFLAISLGLYAQEKDTAQGEQKIKLDLVWEKEIPEGVKDFVFLDEDGYNVFSVQCKNPEKALKEKRILMIQDGKLKLCRGDEMRVMKEVPLRGGNITISKNGRNIATIEGLERDPSGKGGFVDKPATLRLYNWKGEELASTQISPGGWEYFYLYPLGNDQTIAISKVGGEGTFYQVSVFLREGEILKEVFRADGQYPTGILDYAEDGSVVFFLQTKWDAPTEYEERIKCVERIVIDNTGKQVARYNYQHPGWAGWVSPKGNYLVEVTRGKYLVVRNRDGGLIAEHQVQGPGNYYAAFSPDEKYLCVTPGPWRIYFFETETGKMLWEYAHPDSFILYLSLACNNGGFAYVYSQPWSCPAPDRKTTPIFVLPDKSLHIFDKSGHLVNLLKPVEKISVIQLTSDGQYLFLRVPTKFLLYHISKSGGE